MTTAVLETLRRRRAIAVERERRYRQAARIRRPTPAPPFGDWIAAVRPEHVWTAAHFRAMQAVLDDVTAGRLRRVFFQVPIRHGKTEHNTIGYAASRLEADPALRIIVGSYNQRQANRLSRQIRRVMRRRGVALSRDRNTSAEWETEAGGGVIAIGAGSGAASLNADLILIDDPIGSRDDAESQAHRDRVFDWLTNDLFARAEPHTAILMSMSRWHADDPAGRIKERFGDRWHFVDLPGEAEADDPLGRAIGDPLWPELRGRDWLEEKRVELLDYGFASLIQGRPRPREGGMFKWGWWKLLEARPTAGTLVRYWDLAGTRPKHGGHDPDYTAGALLRRLDSRDTVVEHVRRFRVEVAARDAMIEAEARRDVKTYGAGVVYWLERQAGISGEEASDALVRRLQALGIAVFSEHPTGSKEERWRPLASAAMAGNVFLAPDDTDPERQWHNAFRAELADLPTGKHDDQADAAAGAFNKLDHAAQQQWRPFRFRL